MLRPHFSVIKPPVLPLEPKDHSAQGLDTQPQMELGQETERGSFGLNRQVHLLENRK